MVFSVCHSSLLSSTSSPILLSLLNLQKQPQHVIMQPAANVSQSNKNILILFSKTKKPKAPQLLHSALTPGSLADVHFFSNPNPILIFCNPCMKIVKFASNRPPCSSGGGREGTVGTVDVYMHHIARQGLAFPSLPQVRRRL